MMYLGKHYSSPNTSHLFYCFYSQSKIFPMRHFYTFLTVFVLVIVVAPTFAQQLTYTVTTPLNTTNTNSIDCTNSSPAPETQHIYHNYHKISNISFSSTGSGTIELKRSLGNAYQTALDGYTYDVSVRPVVCTYPSTNIGSGSFNNVASRTNTLYVPFTLPTRPGNYTYYVMVAKYHRNGNSYSHTDPFTIRVANAPANTYTIIANSTTGGYTSGGGNFTAGSDNDITATPYSGYIFDRWSSNLGYHYDNPLTVNVTQNRTYTAYFTQNTASNYTIITNSAGGGTTSGGGTYAPGTYRTITATPNSGYTFNYWEDSNGSTNLNSSFGFTVNQNNTYTAYFSQNQTNYTVTLNQATGGTATGGGTYPSGATCYLNATPAANYTFSGWYNGSTLLSNNRSYNFIVNGNKTITPAFLSSAPAAITCTGCNQFNTSKTIPRDGATKVAKSVHFEWDHELGTNIDHYRIELWETSTNNNISLMGNLSDNVVYNNILPTTGQVKVECTISSGSLLQHDTEYEWKVTAYRANNTAISCFIRKFRTYPTPTELPDTHSSDNFGKAKGAFNNVVAFKNGTDEKWYTNASGPHCGGTNKSYHEYSFCTPSQYSYPFGWQCVEYAFRYYQQVYGLGIVGGNGDDYDKKNSLGLRRFQNGNTTKLPKVGDLISFERSTWGHVAIVTGVSNGKVYIAQQNIGNGSVLTNFGYGIPYSVNGSGIVTIQKGAWTRTLSFLRAEPELIEPGNLTSIPTITTTTPVFKWERHDNIKGYNLFIKKLVNGCYTLTQQVKITGNNCSSAPSISPLVAGETYYWRIEALYGNGSVYSEARYFTVSPNATSTSGGGAYVDNDNTICAIRSLGSVLSGASVNIKFNGYWYEVGRTDESGNLLTTFTKNIVIGDSVTVRATGYYPLAFTADAELVNNHRIRLPFISNGTTNGVLRPSVSFTQPMCVTSSNTVTLKVKGQGMTGYEIYGNEGEPTYTHTATDSIITYIIPSEGYNSINIRFFYPNDTIRLNKSIEYYPSAAFSQHTKTLSVTNPYTIPVSLFINNQYLKDIIGTETITVPNTTASFGFSANGYTENTVEIDSATNTMTINLVQRPDYNLNTTVPTIAQTAKYVGVGVTLLSASNGSNTVIRQNRTYTNLLLQPISETIEVSNAATKMAVAIDEPVNYQLQDLYLYKKVGLTNYKILPTQFSAQQIELETNTQKLILNNIAASSSFALMRRLAPITVNNIPATITQMSSLMLPLTHFFTDPDLLPNDMSYSFGNTSDLSFTVLGDSVRVQSLSCASGLKSFNVVTTHDGLTRQVMFNITVLPIDKPVISGLSSVCQGDTIALMVSNGVNKDNVYYWNTGANTSTIRIGFPVGGSVTSSTYSVTVINSTGCMTSASKQISINTTPIPSISAISSGCIGTVFTLTAQTPVAGVGATYLWNNGESMPQIYVNPSVNTGYTVTVTSSTGCSASAAQSVVVGALPIASFMSSVNVLNVSFTDNSTHSNNYFWSFGDGTTSTLQNPTHTYTSTGNYQVCFIATNNCGSTQTCQTIAVTCATPITNFYTASNGLNVGFTNASTNAIGSSWSFGDGTTSTLSNPTHNYTNAGAYTVCLTSTGPSCGGSSHQHCKTITVSCALARASVAGNLFICNSSNTVLTANNVGDGCFYYWNTGVSTASITVSSIGNYSVTVTSASGCKASTTVTVSNSTITVPIINGTNTICAGDNTTLAITQQPATTYQWNTGYIGANLYVSVPSRTSASAITYTVTATNSAGCSTVGVKVLKTNPAPIVSIDGQASFCQGGSATLTANTYPTSSGMTYLWNTGVTTRTAVFVTAATFSVMVTDTNGCIGVARKVTSIPPTPTVNILGDTSFCTSSTINLMASTLVSNCRYKWSTGDTLPMINIGVSGIYVVTTTSSAGCTATNRKIVVAKPLPIVSIQGKSVLDCNTRETNLQASGGASYQWSNGGITSNNMVNQAGVYTVIVTNNGCNSTAKITITSDFIRPVATIIGNVSFCTGSTTNLVAIGGNNYSWSNGSTNSVITIDKPDNYVVTVTSQNGCSAVAEHSIRSIDTNVSIEGDNRICLGSSTTLFAEGFNNNYVWSNGVLTPENDIAPLTTTTYAVTAISLQGCTAVDSIVVEVVTPVVPVITQNNNTLLANGGVFYNWSTGDIGAVISVKNSGVYTVTVTDENGCASTANINVFFVNSSTQSAQLFSNIMLFPNPTKGEFTLVIDDADFEQGSLLITNALGQIIGRQLITKRQTISLQDQAEGVYFLRISTEKGEVTTKRLILQR
jgi:PKD repeat protein